VSSDPQSPNFALAALCVAGTIMLALAAAAPWIVRSFDYQAFVPLLAASGLVTIMATRLAAEVPVRTGLIVVLGLALAMRLVLVVIDPMLSTDLYRYVWDGRVQAAGINPYAYVPADPALAALRDGAIYPHINRADYAVTAYPPVAQMFFLAVTRLSESVASQRSSRCCAGSRCPRPRSSPMRGIRSRSSRSPTTATSRR
jgi:alpha-1,6-mannosyltransferase